VAESQHLLALHPNLKKKTKTKQPSYDISLRTFHKKPQKASAEQTLQHHKSEISAQGHAKSF